MADNPSSILLLRLQSTGSNTNLWGGYLNTALQTLEQAGKGYQTLAITTDTTVSWSNYSTGNIGQCARLKITGTLTAAAALTLPTYQNFVSIENSTTGGFAVTAKCSGGVGVSIPNGSKADLYCDAVDYYNSAATIFPTGITVAGQISGVVAATAGTQATNLQQVQTLVAASVPLGTAGTFLNSGSDLVRGYVTDKLTVSGSLVLSTVNGGGNEHSNIDFTFDEGQQALVGGMYGL